VTVAAMRFAEDEISGVLVRRYVLLTRRLGGFNKSLDTCFFDEPTKIV